MCDSTKFAITHKFAGVRDDKGKSPLDRAMEDVYETEGSPEVAYYLMSCGCDRDEETLADLLCGACQRSKLSIVKDLVEQHKLDPNSEFQWLSYSIGQCEGYLS